MIMSDTCATHRSRVPRRSSRRIKGRATTVQDERGPDLGVILCFVCGSCPWGAASLLLFLFILLNLFKCSCLNYYYYYTSIAHNIPVHTKLSIVIYLYIQLSICILLFLIYLFFIILLLLYVLFCSVTFILLHCSSFGHENKFPICVNIPENKAHSDSFLLWPLCCLFFWL